MHVLHGVVWHVWFYVYDAYYVYVHMVEEKALHVCQVWQSIRCAYRIRTKVGAKDQLNDKYKYFIST